MKKKYYGAMVVDCKGVIITCPPKELLELDGEYYYKMVDNNEIKNLVKGNVNEKNIEVTKYSTKKVIDDEPMIFNTGDGILITSASFEKLSLLYDGIDIMMSVFKREKFVNLTEFEVTK